MKGLDFSNVCLLIPAYNPERLLVSLVDQLTFYNFRRIVIVNDGSREECKPIFDSLRQIQNVTVFEHYTNQGKGGAIKSGLALIQQHHTDNLAGVVTLDADGQHLCEDILAVARSLLEHPSQLILGVRHFNQDVPLRSRFGNVLSRYVFKWLYKVDIKDTQTGLRGLPTTLLTDFININSVGYEYELECLIRTHKYNIDIYQHPINTVYINNNKASHFNPIFDSLRIYFIFFRFAIVSLLSFAIDVTLFAICHTLGFSIASSLVFARVISSGFNFYNNKYLVYKSQSRRRLLKEAMGYATLAVFSLVVSYGLIRVLVHDYYVGVIQSKIVIDALLFFLNFVVQRYVVFKSSRLLR